MLQICLLTIQIIGSETFTIIRYIDQTTQVMIKGFYFEVKLVKLTSMFDIFKRILGKSFKFRFKQRVAQSQRFIPPMRGIESQLPCDRRSYSPLYYRGRSSSKCVFQKYKYFEVKPLLSSDK